MSCVVGGCKSHSSRKENKQDILSFHRFPKDAVKKKEWVNCIGRPNWIAKKHSHICSKHFTLNSFVCNETKWRRLREDAVPTLFMMDRRDEMEVLVEVCEEEHNAVLQTQGTAHHQKQSNTYLTGRQDPVAMEIETGPSASVHINESPLTLTSCEIISHQSQESLTQTTRTYSEINYIRRITMLEKELEKVKKISKRRLRKINTLTKRVSRLGKKNENLYSILMEKLKQENIETEYITMLDKLNKNDIIKRFLQKQLGDSLPREYSLDIKKFAVTLNYLSPKAYTYIREQFQDILPHPKTISTWYRSLDCNPGFTTEALDAIRSRVAQHPDRTLFCVISIDEMAIRKMVEWDSHNYKYHGHVNVGCDLESDAVPLAVPLMVFKQ